jgi:uncharacterized protein YPO0396
MELFHQTVSMKSVGNLTDFVRSHMLEPFDAESWTKRIIGHFEDLTKAHDAVRRAQAQLELLQPLLAVCDAHDELGGQITSLGDQRSALSFFFAERKEALLQARIAGLEQERSERHEELKALKVRREDLRENEKRLTVERAGHGGDRLSEIERRIEDDSRSCDERSRKAQRFAELLGAAAMGPVETAEQFAARRRGIAAAAERASLDRADCQNRLSEIAVDARTLADEADGLNAELLSLRSRTSSIPKRNLDLRSWLCRELGLAAEQLPFAGELIGVRTEEAAWEGAAERVLRGFALSILVPDERYPDVADWINEHHLDARLVYFRVPSAAAAAAGAPHRPVPEPARNSLFSKLEIKDTGFYPWLERELAVRAGHECVETMTQFRRATRAVTKTGQTKGAGGRHEKDDRSRIDDRSKYVLGWSNERKIDALLVRARSVQQRQHEIAAERTKRSGALEALIKRGETLAGLAETREFRDIDWQSLVNRIEGLKAEKARLEQASGELERLSRLLVEIAAEIETAEKEQEQITGAIGSLASGIDTAAQALDEVGAVLAGPGRDGDLAAARRSAAE